MVIQNIYITQSNYMVKYGTVFFQTKQTLKYNQVYRCIADLQYCASDTLLAVRKLSSVLLPIIYWTPIFSYSYCKGDGKGCNFSYTYSVQSYPSSASLDVDPMAKSLAIRTQCKGAGKGLQGRWQRLAKLPCTSLWMLIRWSRMKLHDLHGRIDLHLIFSRLKPC